MGAPGYDRDPVDREFDRLFEDASRAGSPTHAAPVGDAVFESLLAEFRTLNDFRGAETATGMVGQGASAPPSADSRASDRAARLIQALREFAAHPSMARQSELQPAMRHLECLAVNLQLSLRSTRTHTVLAVGVGGQPFALIPERVIEIREAAASTEKLTVYSLRAWLVHDGDASGEGALHVVVSLASGRRAILAVDSTEGLLAGKRLAPGPLLRATPGIAGMTAVGARLLPLLDVDALFAGTAART